MQQPTRDALYAAKRALTGKTLAEARAAFVELTDGEELTKMAYRFVWWQQNHNLTDENLDPYVNVKAIFANFLTTDFLGLRNEIIDFTTLQQLPNANELTQLIIDLVLCNLPHGLPKIRNVPADCRLTITSPTLIQLCASTNQDLVFLDLSNCPSLTRLWATDIPKLTTLDLSNNPTLTELLILRNLGLTDFSIAPSAQVPAAAITDINAMVAENRARLGLPPVDASIYGGAEYDALKA